MTRKLAQRLHTNFSEVNGAFIAFDHELPPNPWPATARRHNFMRLNARCTDPLTDTFVKQEEPSAEACLYIDGRTCFFPLQGRRTRAPYFEMALRRVGVGGLRTRALWKLEGNGRCATP